MGNVQHHNCRHHPMACSHGGSSIDAMSSLIAKMSYHGIPVYKGTESKKYYLICRRKHQHEIEVFKTTGLRDEVIYHAVVKKFAGCWFKSPKKK